MLIDGRAALGLGAPFLVARLVEERFDVLLVPCCLLALDLQLSLHARSGPQGRASARVERSTRTYVL